MEEGSQERMDAQDEIFKGFFKTLLFVQKLSNPIVYQPTESPKRKILVVGNMGNGKSTILNKMGQVTTNDFEKTFF